MEQINEIPVLAFFKSEAAWLEKNRAQTVSSKQVKAILTGTKPIMLCHHLGLASKITAPLYNVMELWAFVHPAKHCVPSVSGLAKFLKAPKINDAQAAALFIRHATKLLLQQLDAVQEDSALAIAQMMRQGGWSWGSLVMARLKPQKSNPSALLFPQIIKTLTEWRVPKSDKQKSETPSTNGQAQGNHAEDMMNPDLARTLLRQALGRKAEPRAGQIAYMNHITEFFRPRKALTIAAAPVMLAQADTGIGKTIGYLVPAYLAARAHQHPVWVVTYTRALQNQIDRESAKLPRLKVAIRKGRENYLCLLNFEESLRTAEDAVLAGLVARWLGASRDGDIRSGDFPSWLLSHRRSARWIESLTDRRQTCIHAACPHYRRCFVERQRVASQEADMIIANHALVLSHSLFANQETKPPYYIFDEGHHIFSAADQAFSFYLTGRHMAELRHWLIGEGRAQLLPQRFADQGLAARIDHVLNQHPSIEPLLDHVNQAARFLPQAGFGQRLAQNRPVMLAEVFLAELRQVVLDAQEGFDDGYSLESLPQPLSSAKALAEALRDLQEAMSALLAALERLDEGVLVSVIGVLRRWVEYDLPVWVAMSERATQSGGLVQWVDRFVIERDEGRELDIGMMRHALDPGRSFAQKVLAKSKASLITSASLACDQEEQGQESKKDWESAAWQTGVRHLPYPAKHVYARSPFDYAKVARVFVITDVARETGAAAEAMAALFCASGGGALGLWTAVRRLRLAHPVIFEHLDKAGLLLLAQHVDAMALPALMDIFREEESSCLLGTDALRDGVDVPGRTLRLIVFDRMPWPRPDILHRARRKLFPPRAYDDMIAGLRLQQAFGRLIRSQSDRGVFVLLDGRFPSRLKKFFPKTVMIKRLTLAESLEHIKMFY